MENKKFKVSELRDLIATYDEIVELSKNGYFVNSKDGENENQIITLNIITRVLSLNAIYGKDAIYGKAELAKELKENIHSDELSKVLRIRGCKVGIEFDYRIANKAICDKTGKVRNQKVYDVANYAGMNKMIEDALVDVGVLKDDSQKFVSYHITKASKDYKLKDGENVVKIRFLIDQKSLCEYKDSIDKIFQNYNKNEILEIRKYNLEQEIKKQKEKEERENRKKQRIESVNDEETKERVKSKKRPISKWKKYRKIK